MKKRVSLVGLLALALVLLAGGSALALVTPRTQSHSQAVDVLFEPESGYLYYKIYRHARTDDFNVDFQELCSVQVNASGDVVASSCASGDDSVENVQPDVNSSKYVVFKDRGDVQDYREYYYLVTQGPSSYANYSGNPEDYYIAAAFPPNQTRHGSYTEFTGACTGCHGLHSAQSSQKLLKGATVTDLCGTCHDGSVSKYDEVRGKVLMEGGKYAPAPAGPFGKQLADNLGTGFDPDSGYGWASSVHNVFRAGGPVWAYVYVAPGSGFRPAGQSSNQPSYGSGTDFSPIGWGSQFSCISCHEPHNRPQNFRLLRNDIADKASGAGDHGGNLKVRGLSETGTTTKGSELWPQAYSDHGSIDGSTVYISQTKFLSGTAKFCSQCHRAFYNRSIRMVDDRVLTSMFTVGSTPPADQPDIRTYFRELMKLYANGIPTQAQVNNHNTTYSSQWTKVKNACSTCHAIVAEVSDTTKSSNQDVVLTDTIFSPTRFVYIGWSTGNRMLDTGANAGLASVMGAGHRHPTEVAAHAVRISGKVIEQSTADPLGEIQVRVKPGPVNVGVPLEGRYSAPNSSSIIDLDYSTNKVVCLTCHMAHGSRTGVNDSENWVIWYTGDKWLESAYNQLNGVNGLLDADGDGTPDCADYNLNGTCDAGEFPVSQSTAGYWRNTSTTPAQGVSTVLARFSPFASVCYRCHSTK